MQTLHSVWENNIHRALFFRPMEIHLKFKKIKLEIQLTLSQNVNITNQEQDRNPTVQLTLQSINKMLRNVLVPLTSPLPDV